MAKKTWSEKKAKVDSRKKKWTVKELTQVHNLRKEGKSWSEIGKIVKTKTWKSFERKCRRINWTEFFKDPEQYLKDSSDPNHHLAKKWTDDEMIQLDAYLQAGKSYDFIAEKLDRSFTSIESKAQQTDWKAWREIRKMEIVDPSQAAISDQKEIVVEQLINAILHVCHHDPFTEIDTVELDYFLAKVGLEENRLIIPFDELKEKAKQRLIEFGLGNPESMELGEGTYVIVGDSHGKHTRKDMFKLLDNVNKFLKPTKIIHVGHILDDDKDISYDWGRFNNLVIMAREEELRTIQAQRNKFKFKFDIVRDGQNGKGEINIGDLLIANQEMISDFVKTSIGSLDIEGKAIVACHRLEFASKCTNAESSYCASPGCLCERHIIKTIKQIDFSDGKVIKEAYHEGFSKYRRMGYMHKYWEQGLIVVQVDKDLNHTVILCPIKKTNMGYTTSYFNKMITSKGVFSPDKKIFVIGDMHCDKHDINVLDVEEQISKDYKPDVCVNVGDTFNYSSLNHHVMDRGGVITKCKLLDESAHTNYVLQRVAKWAKENYIICGNHERFAQDFTERFPQFDEFLEFQFLCGIKDMGYKITDLKNVLKIGSASFIHGEIKMYGQSGSKLEKAAKTFGRDIFIGHIHRPEIRFGCYSIGLSGELDQEYNEPEASNWIHGFGLCNQFKGQSWLTSIAIDNNHCVINNKTYKPSDISSWKIPKYKAKLVYEFDK